MDELLSACRKGNTVAHKALFKRLFPVLFPVCQTYADNRNDAEELLNICFYKVLLKLSTFRHEGVFDGWAKRIAVREIIDEYRKNKKYKELVTLKENEELVFLSDHQIDEENAGQADWEEVLELLRCLPKLTAKVFGLIAFEEYKHQEVSELLGISLSASKWHYASAKLKLKTSIENRGLLK